MNLDILNKKHTGHDDPNIIPTKFIQNKVKEEETDENPKEKSKKDEKGVGKLQNIDVYLTQWTRNTKENEGNQYSRQAASRF